MKRYVEKSPLLLYVDLPRTASFADLAAKAMWVFPTTTAGRVRSSVILLVTLLATALNVSAQGPGGKEVSSNQENLLTDETDSILTIQMAMLHQSSRRLPL